MTSSWAQAPACAWLAFNLFRTASLSSGLALLPLLCNNHQPNTSAKSQRFSPTDILQAKQVDSDALLSETNGWLELAESRYISSLCCVACAPSSAARRSRSDSDVRTRSDSISCAALNTSRSCADEAGRGRSAISRQSHMIVTDTRAEKRGLAAADAGSLSRQAA